MKEPYGEGLASHTDPESCVDSRKAGHEALTGAHAGGVSSREILRNQSADAVSTSGRHFRGFPQLEMPSCGPPLVTAIVGAGGDGDARQGRARQIR